MLRLWKVHPKYLDKKEFLQLWNDGLKAQKILFSDAQQPRSNPELDVFRQHPLPLDALGYYLFIVFEESKKHGLHLKASDILYTYPGLSLDTTEGQVKFEWKAYLKTLQSRAIEVYKTLRDIEFPDTHPLFIVQPGDADPWEKK